MIYQASADRLVLDDFEEPTGVSAIGTRWQGFTDRVMGGVSDMEAGYVRVDEGIALRMTGRVSLQNNGGFIQVRLPLATNRGFFDASEYSGVALTVRGTEGRYALHLRTARTRLPWSYYYAELPVGDSWTRIEVPFTSFEGDNMIGRKGPDVERLVSIALVAGEEEFDADVTVSEIEFYR